MIHSALPLRAAAVCLALGLAACTSLPDLTTLEPPLTAPALGDDSAAQAAPYPALIPLGPLLAEAEAAQAGGRAPAQNALAARLAALQARAAAARAPVVPDATSRRMGVSLR